MRFSSNGTLFSGGADGAVKAWDLTRPTDVNVLRGDTYETWSVQISPDGKTVIAGGGDGTVRVWDLRTGQLLTTHTLKAAEMILVCTFTRWSAGGHRRPGPRAYRSLESHDR